MNSPVLTSTLEKSSILEIVLFLFISVLENIAIYLPLIVIVTRNITLFEANLHIKVGVIFFMMWAEIRKRRTKWETK
jgi:hypothetical protein